MLFLGQSKDKITKKYPFCMSKLGHSILIFRTVSHFPSQIWDITIIYFTII